MLLSKIEQAVKNRSGYCITILALRSENDSVSLIEYMYTTDKTSLKFNIEVNNSRFMSSENIAAYLIIKQIDEHLEKEQRMIHGRQCGFQLENCSNKLEHEIDKIKISSPTILSAALRNKIAQSIIDLQELMMAAYLSGKSSFEVNRKEYNEEALDLYIKKCMDAGWAIKKYPGIYTFDFKAIR